MERKRNWRYQAISETIDDPLLGKYHTYGIQVYVGREQETLIHDVTPDHDLAERLTGWFNCHQLSPIHLRDVLEDMLP